MSDSSPLPPPSTRRPRLRFTLRLLLVFVTLLCIGLGIWTHRARQQGWIVERIKRGGGSVDYDFGTAIYLGVDKPSHVPDWLLRLFGPDFFHNVLGVEIAGDPNVIAELPKLPQVRDLRIACDDVNDGDFPNVDRMCALKLIVIRRTRPYFRDTPCVTDRTLERLGS